ncbi:hypothetical protein INT44_007158 [Umbelopsis vinacea]|uniref:Uncharacterized protein n=1 Tax=Umbelopsis vinacea TaxID=44442 RepID=A0A8H7PGJ3_9FUNG|nr:hypothetical protein INT44_007158 [Umbelopsis vinacea]
MLSEELVVVESNPSVDAIDDMHVKKEPSGTYFSSEKRFLLRWLDMVTLKSIVNYENEDQRSLVDLEVSAKAIPDEATETHHLVACERYQQLASVLSGIRSDDNENANIPIDVLSVGELDGLDFSSIIQESQVTTVEENYYAGELVSIQQLAKDQKVELCTLDLHLSYRPGNAAEILARMDARDTTRKEDKAYALAGIFSIYSPLAYGEGLKSRERLLHQLAIQEGDLSFLSFPSKITSSGNHLPGTEDISYQLAICRQSSAPVMVSHFGISFEVQLVEGEGVSKILTKLGDWKDLKIGIGRFVGLTDLIKEARAGHQEFSSLKLAIVHDIRSIMLVMEYDEDWQTGGGGPVKLCYRLQCCQIEEDEFERLFDDVESDYGITANFERIWLGDKHLTYTSNSRKASVHPKRKR